MSNRKIAIIGAGPAGCALARLLHIAGTDVTVFEGESSPNFRSQGGTLDLHTTTGLACIKEAGLWNEFLKYARYDGQYMAVTDKNLKYYFRREADDGVAAKLEERPEIDRASLREMLANSLPEGMIKWSHHLKRIDGRTLVFEHGIAEGFDLIVGAEGAWSKVRKEIDPTLVPKYVGIAMYELEIRDPEKNAPNICKLVNRGSVFASAEGVRMAIQQMGDGSINLSSIHVDSDPDWAKPEKCGYDSHNLKETIPALLNTVHADWSPALREALEKSNGKCNPRSLYMLPVNTKWTHKPGFTIIGDAAHLMTPFAGEGVNQALEDAMTLARAINGAATKDDEAFDKDIEAFEKAMQARCGKVQELTNEMMQDWFFTPGAPKSIMAKSMSRVVRYKLPWLLKPLGTAAVHTYFFCKEAIGY